MVAIARPRFQLGRTVATPAALRVLEESNQTPQEFLHRHVHGDWGDLSDDDAEANEVALGDGSRILSAYILGSGKKIWSSWVALSGVSIWWVAPSDLNTDLN